MSQLAIFVSRALVLVVFTSLTACESPFSGSEDQLGVQTINGDTTQEQVFQVGADGSDLEISTAAGITTFNFPDASATSRGVLTSDDWSRFDQSLGPSGNTAFTTTRAVTRSGFLQIVASNSQAVPSIAGESLALPFESQTRVDTDYFSHDTVTDPNQIMVLTSGDYRVSFSVGIQSSNGARENYRAWLEDDGTEVVPSKVYCYTRNNTSTRHCSLSGNLITTVDADSILELRVQGRDTSTWGLGTQGETLANESWILIEKI